MSTRSQGHECSWQFSVGLDKPQPKVAPVFFCVSSRNVARFFDRRCKRHGFSTMKKDVLFPIDPFTEHGESFEVYAKSLNFMRGPGISQRRPSLERSVQSLLELLRCLSMANRPTRLWNAVRSDLKCMAVRPTQGTIQDSQMSSAISRL